MHPRPQLARPAWTDLCGPWRFATDPDDIGVRSGWTCGEGPYDRDITVPFPPESKLSGIHEATTVPVVWYCRDLDLARPAAGRRTVLHLGAVDYRARVWVNGVSVGSHEGGHTPFACDLTDALTDDGPQRVVVRAEDPVDDPAQPRGKQDWRPEPHAIWYHRTTGIWQPVWLEEVDDCHVERLDWTTDVADGTVEALVRVTAPHAAASVRIVIALDGEVLAESTVAIRGPETRVTLTLAATAHAQDSGHLTWSPDRPTLLDADVEVLGRGGDALDHVDSYVGLRSVGFADGRFLLNGLPLFLRLALHQGYWPESHLTAPSPDALRREVELAKEMGLNGVRIHQKAEDPRFLYWCDKIGLLVWGEMPSAYTFSTTAVERVVAEWTEIVRRDRSHPCVVTWVPLNESWGVAQIAVREQQQHYATALYHLTKALDPTRPVISNDGWEHTESDIWGVHDYASSGDRLTDRYAPPADLDRMLRDRRPGRRRVLLGDPVRRGQPIVLTEFGGLSYVPGSGQNWFGYATVEGPEEFEERLDGLIGAVLDNPELGGFCYTQLTDTEQERNGLVTEAREPKIPLERIRAMVQRPAAAVPSEEIDANRRSARRAASTDED
ncbi:glycoside hydrolase family 2 [Phycicoccus sp. CMS6Z-2]|nr:glycoside hydrolase family 2 [Phycicoccus flavus]